MKAATGELNLTVITLIAIAAVVGFFWVLFNNVTNSLNEQWNKNIAGSKNPGKGAIPYIIVQR